MSNFFCIATMMLMSIFADIKAMEQDSNSSSKGIIETLIKAGEKQTESKDSSASGNVTSNSAKCSKPVAYLVPHPIDLAIHRQDVNQVRELLKTNTDVNGRQINLNRWLMKVIGRGVDSDLVKIFIESKANVNVKGNFWVDRSSNEITPIIYASKKGKKSLVELLISEKANVNDKRTNGETALYYAIKSDSKEIVDILIKAKADVNPKQ